jgi:hypothetical protein
MKKTEVIPHQTKISTKRLLEYVFDDRSMQGTILENQDEESESQDQQEEEPQTGKFKQCLHERDVAILIKDINKETFGSISKDNSKTSGRKFSL